MLLSQEENTAIDMRQLIESEIINAFIKTIYLA